MDPLSCPKCGNEEIDLRIIAAIETETIKRPVGEILVELVFAAFLLLGAVAELPEVLKFRDLLRYWWNNPGLVTSACLVLMFLIIGVFAGLFLLSLSRSIYHAVRLLNGKINIRRIREEHPHHRYICLRCWHSWI
jgi:hypothetical protein